MKTMVSLFHMFV